VARWRLVNRTQLSDLIGCNPDTVTVYIREGMPVVSPGGPQSAAVFDAVACLEWWRAERATVSEKEAAQTRQAIARAKAIELKLAEQSAGLVSRDTVIAEGRAFVKGWQGQVRAIPRRARQSGIVMTPEAEAGLSDLCRHVLEEIAQWKTVEEAEAAGGAEA